MLAGVKLEYYKNNPLKKGLFYNVTVFSRQGFNPLQGDPDIIFTLYPEKINDTRMYIGGIDEKSSKNIQKIENRIIKAVNDFGCGVVLGSMKLKYRNLYCSDGVILGAEKNLDIVDTIDILFNYS